MAFSKSPNFIPLNIQNPNPPLETSDSVSTLSINEATRRRRRRDIILSISATLVLDLQSSSSANAVDFFKFAESQPEPERSLEDAQEGIRNNARYIKEIVKEMMMNIEKKKLIDEEKELRRSASNMKQDMYLIIQSKPPKDRSLLRSLYASLFNNITKLDYAARDEDAPKVFDYYHNIVAILDDIFLQL